MQGKKEYQEKLFAQFQLSERIPKNNFYRRLKGVLALDFLYKSTGTYYGESGQKSIDPVVFFELCLVGYFENIISNRKLIDHCSMRLDNQQLPDIVKRLQGRLWKQGLYWENCVADTGYSSRENYAILEDMNLKSFIPPHGTHKGGPLEIVYMKEHDHYLYPQGKVIPFRKVFLNSGTKTKKKSYRASSKICKGCPLRESCLGKVNEKQFSVTYYREEYERNIARVNSPLGRYMKGKRQSTVEPVFGTLTQFMGLRKINTIGLKQANKVMHLSAIAYNLKKYLKFEQKSVKSGVGKLALTAFVESVVQDLFSALPRHRKSTLQH